MKSALGRYYTVNVYDAGVTLAGNTTIENLRTSWTFTPTDPLRTGKRILTAKVVATFDGSVIGGNGDGESGGGGIGSFIAKTIATAVGGAFGLKQIKKFFKSTPKATGAVDDLTKKTKNLTRPAHSTTEKNLQNPCCARVSRKFHREFGE